MNRFARIAFFISIVIFVGCRKEDGLTNATGSGIFSQFYFTPTSNSQLKDTLFCTISNDTISGYYPLSADAHALVPSFVMDGYATVKVGDAVQNSGKSAIDFSSPVTYQVTGADGSVTQYTVILKHFTGLPIMYLTTAGSAAINSKEVAATGALKIDSNSTSFSSYSGTASFYLHGNTTASYPKLPYKIKLDSKSGLLGMPSGKEWILLANYDDKSLLRNYVALELSRMFGMTYTPKSQFVELVLNGAYVGNYQLTEQIDVDKNKLNITDMSSSDNSGDAVTGGYLIEADNKNEDDDHVRINTAVENNSFIIHDPSSATTAQINYIQDYLNQTETALYGSNFIDSAVGYRQWLNPESCIQYFWVNELSRNNDAGFWSSSYLYKDRSALLNMGPVWDFDLAFGNVTYNNNQLTTGWWIRNQAWFPRLFQDPAFTQAAIAKWKQLRPSLDSLSGMIDNMAAYLDQSQKENFKQWDILNVLMPNVNSEAAGSYAGEITFLKQWIQGRISWIDANLNTLQE